MTAATGTITDVTDGSRVIQQGLMPYTITLTDTCQVGDLIGYDADTPGWYRADAGDKRYAEFVAGEKCVKSGDTITVFRQAIVSGLSLGVASDPVYCGNTTDGAYEDIPDSSGYQQIVGFCLSASEVLLCPNAAAGVFGCQRETRGFGGYIRSEADSSTTLSQWGGLRIDVKSLTGATTGAVYGLWVFIQTADTDNTEGSFIRLEDASSSSSGIDYFISCQASGADPPDYFLDLHPTEPTGSAWSCGTPASGSITGNIKVNTGAGDRYIPLYSAA